MGEFAAIFSNIWPRESVIQDELFDKELELMPMNLQFLDMPYMCRQNKDGFQFVQALARCPDLELFGL